MVNRLAPGHAETPAGTVRWDARYTPLANGGEFQIFRFDPVVAAVLFRRQEARCNQLLHAPGRNSQQTSRAKGVIT